MVNLGLFGTMLYCLIFTSSSGAATLVRSEQACLEGANLQCTRLMPAG